MNTQANRSSLLKLGRTCLNATLVILTFSVLACTKRPVLTSVDEVDLETKTIEEDETEKVVEKNELRKPKTWESSGKDRVTKVAKSKSKKDSSWETGSTSSSLAAPGGLVRGKTMSLADKAAESKRPMPSSPSVGGADSKGMTGPSPASRKMIERSRLHENQVGAGILTAGSFDDADDIKIFQKFWDASELSSANLGEFARKSWANSLKKASTRRHSALQLAFVVDTTGSMGDELEYLKNEFQSIVAQVNKSYPGVEKEYAFMVYRDQGDEYVTRGLNFTADANEVQEFITKQSADGGGDYPEAVREALDEALSRLDWNEKNDSARMIFHIADAPAHMHDMQGTFAAVEKLADAGISIFPVAASGVMDTAEAMMRATALMTGGKYIFLTDDSGVGLPHAAPKHPCYDVEKLKDIMVRVIKDKISGTRSYPVASNIIRHGGERSAGLCRTNKKVVGQW